MYFAPFPLHYPSSSPSLVTVLFSCLVCVPLYLIRIDCISMGLGYLQACGQVISGYTTKFTPFSSSSQCPELPGGAWGFMNPSSISDVMLLGPILCRSYTGKHSYLWFMNPQHSSSSPSSYICSAPFQFFSFRKLEIFIIKY